jgi:hypothetical protein
MSAIEVYEGVVALAGDARHAERVAEMRRVFVERTGAFGPDDRWFEARSRAFLDDAVTRQGFAREVEGELPEAQRVWIAAFGRAHRGLFRAAERSGRWLVVDAWSGAEFIVDTADEATREELHAADGWFDGRVVAIASPLAVALLPGALFHPSEATAPIDAVIGAAKGAGLSGDDTCDALLRMELSFRSLSRVKAAYAYRPEALRHVSK